MYKVFKNTLTSSSGAIFKMIGHMNYIETLLNHIVMKDKHKQYNHKSNVTGELLRVQPASRET